VIIAGGRKMKLVTLECPKCNAQLQINAEISQAICNFCGYHFLIDDEVKKVDICIRNVREAGREFEYGRRSVIGGNKELADEVHSLIEPLSRLNELSPAAIRIHNILDKTQKTVDSDDKPLGRILPWIWFGGVFVFFLIGMISDTGIVSAILTSLVLAIIAFGIVKAIQINRKKTLEKLDLQYKKISDEMKQMNEELRKHNMDIIPPDYRYKEAMVFFYNALNNQRAMTIQEAVNLYEDYLHNNKMEAMQAEQLTKLNQLNIKR
jgi:hypothetical protein